MTSAWSEVALGDVAEIMMGQAPPGHSYNDLGDGVGLIAGAGDFGPSGLHPKKYTTSPTRLSAAGDIVLSIRATIGTKVWSDGVYCLGRGVAALRPRPPLDRSYLWHCLSTSEQALAQKGRGATFLQVNRADVAGFRIPLPPIEEQRRIAAVLDYADSLRAKRHASCVLLDSLSRRIFLDMFKINHIPPVTVGLDVPSHSAGWRWEMLTDVARLATGHTPDRDRQEYWNGDIPWISLTEIRGLDGRVAERTELTVSAEGIANSSSVVLPQGTVCFSRTASIGFVTVMGREMSTSQDFVNWVCGDRLDPIYLMHALLASRQRLRALSAGSTHKTIYMRIAEQFRLLVPPLELQRRFAALVGEADRVAEVQNRSAIALDALFASLQHRAFAGQL